MSGVLEERWMNYDDSNEKGTEYIDEKGELVKKRKAELIDIQKIKDSKYYILLPEYYLRPYEPTFISLNDLDGFINNMNKIINTHHLEDALSGISG